MVLETASPVLHGIAAGEEQVVVVLSGNSIADRLNSNQRRMDIAGIRTFGTRVECPLHVGSSLMAQSGNVTYQSNDGCRIGCAAQLSDCCLESLFVGQ